MSDSIMTPNFASLWVQVDGRNTKPEYLGCHDMGDVAFPKGDITPHRCPDPARSGKFQVVQMSQGEEGVPTFTITTPMKRTADLLEDLACPFNIFVNKMVCEMRRDTFTNRDRGLTYYNARATSQGRSGLAARNASTDETLITNG